MSYIKREAVQNCLDNLSNEHLIGSENDTFISLAEAKDRIEEIPTANVVEVRTDYNVGDFCLYGFLDGNKSLAIVEIVKILDDTRGIAEVKFHKVIKDNTGNGFFHYLFKSGGTMNASFKYLKNITPRVD